MGVPDLEHSLRPAERLMALLAPFALRLLGSTLRVRVENEEILTERMARGAPFILASWHGRMLGGAWRMRRYAPVLMVSQSRDGELAARLAAGIGYRPVRGSSSRGGAAALATLISAVQESGSAAHIVDGPRGPAGKIKPGLIVFAQRSGAAIVPIYLFAERCWQAKSWDRMQVPLPFSRVRARLGPPVEVPAELDRAGVEELRQELEKEMERGHADLEAE